MPNYGNITGSTGPDFASGGYKNELLFAPRADFDTIAAPTGAPAALGDKVKVTDDHTFTDGNGWYKWALRLHSPTMKGATVGDDGAQEIEWTQSGDILGDSASTQEQLQNLLNENGITLIQDADCEGGQYVQLGNNCVTPSFKVSFDGKTTKEGKKIYSLEITCKKKYFYSGAVTLKP
jgi:hypothetical protein